MYGKLCSSQKSTWEKLGVIPLSFCLVIVSACIFWVIVPIAPVLSSPKHAIYWFLELELDPFLLCFTSITDRIGPKPSKLSTTWTQMKQSKKGDIKLFFWMRMMMCFYFWGEIYLTTLFQQCAHHFSLCHWHNLESICLWGVPFFSTYLCIL